jgi:hypothetical protein
VRTKEKQGAEEVVTEAVFNALRERKPKRTYNGIVSQSIMKLEEAKKDQSLGHPKARKELMKSTEALKKFGAELQVRSFA